jgi:hypothetical protein
MHLFNTLVAYVFSWAFLLDLLYIFAMAYLAMVVHELGHLVVILVVRWPIEAIQFGEAPFVLTLRRSATIRIGLSPLGGFVQVPPSHFQGLNHEQMQRYLWPLIAILSAGMLVNLAVAVFSYWADLSWWLYFWNMVFMLMAWWMPGSDGEVLRAIYHGKPIPVGGDK